MTLAQIKNLMRQLEIARIQGREGSDLEEALAVMR